MRLSALAPALSWTTWTRAAWAAPIDIDTGVIRTVGANKNGDRFEFHPLTGTRIPGTKIPYWEEAKKMCLEAAQVVPQLRFVAWDVAVTPEGRCSSRGIPSPAMPCRSLPRTIRTASALCRVSVSLSTCKPVTAVQPQAMSGARLRPSDPRCLRQPARRRALAGETRWFSLLAGRLLRKDKGKGRNNMKRGIAWLLALLLCAAPAFASAQADAEEAQITACLRQAHPQGEIADMQRWGDTAAAVLTDQGHAGALRGGKARRAMGACG